MEKRFDFLRTKNPSPKYQAVRIKVKSPDNYVLYEGKAHVAVQHTAKGLKLITRNPVSISADKLLGPRIREALVHDVEFCFTEITLSAKKLGCTNLPCRVREGDVVELG